MAIKFLSNSPNDTSVLYAYTNEVGESPFGDEHASAVSIEDVSDYET